MPIVKDHPEGALVAVKVVPGASREKVAGPLGDRLKVTVRQPPEKGAANKAVAALLAKALGLKAAGLELVRGAARPEKVFRVRGMAGEEVRRRLGLD